MGWEPRCIPCFKDVRDIMAQDNTSLAFANLNKSTGDLHKGKFEIEILRRGFLDNYSRSE
jgi:hypothetical protein